MSFTDRELDIMAVLWDKGPSTAREVRGALKDDLAYNTVLTILRILEDKGFVGRVEEGRAHRYHALVARKAAGKSALTRIQEKVFGGSRELLLTELLGDAKLNASELRRLRHFVGKRIKKEEK
ncbi:MAG: BlaI/MecI/CopY family transcriptional regulator [Gemmatimonadaceae bacterium]